MLRRKDRTREDRDRPRPLLHRPDDVEDGLLLDGVKVLSLCQYLQGPAAAQYLADMGADVVKIEPLAVGRSEWSSICLAAIWPD
jgi:CoA-transferase family III